MVVLGRVGVGRRLEVGAVEEDPEVLAIEEIDEQLVDARVLAHIPERLVVVHLHHPVGAVRLAVPARRIVAVEIEKAPDRVHHGLNLLARNQLRHDEVAVLVEEAALFVGQHGATSVCDRQSGNGASTPGGISTSKVLSAIETSA